MDRIPPQTFQDNADLPLSQETFRMLWDQLQDDANRGLILQDPIQVNLENIDTEFGTNNIIGNEVQLQVEQLHMEPHITEIPNFNSESSLLAQLNHFPPSTDDQSAGTNMPSSTGYASATDATTPPPPSYTPPPTSALAQQQMLPTNVEYRGDHDFQINLGQPTSQAAKSVSWTYSPVLKKLFVDKDKSCPIQFKTATAPPPGCFIRVLPIFKQAENLAEVVARCPNHIGPLGDPSSSHLVLCSDPNTTYYTDGNNGRHQLCVPYSNPPVGTEYSKYLFTFKCFISCVGGLNRRKIQLVFTLENDGGNVLGRQVLDVRVCACPGRDRKAEEKSREKAKTPQKKPLKRGGSKVTSTVGITSFRKKRKTDEDIFYIQVQGREKYELLMKIKESLDLMDYVTPTQVNQYRQQQTQINQQLQLPNGIPNLPRVSSFQSTPPSTSQGNALNHTPPLAMTRSQSFPSQQQQQSTPFAQQQQIPAAVATPPQYTTLDTFKPSSSNSRICKDEADGPNVNMEVDANPPSQGFGLPGNTQLTPPNPCQSQNHHTPPTQDLSIFSWLTRLGLKDYADVFQQKGVHTIDQLEEINMEDLSNIPQPARGTLWQNIYEVKTNLQLGIAPSMLRTSSSASTTSVHSNASLSGGSQVYRATRFTLRQTLSFKVEEEDYEDTGI